MNTLVEDISELLRKHVRSNPTGLIEELIRAAITGMVRIGLDKDQVIKTCDRIYEEYMKDHVVGKVN